MAFGYLDDTQLILYSFKKELGYGRGRKGNWRALIALDALCDEQERLTKRLHVGYFLGKCDLPLSGSISNVKSCSICCFHRQSVNNA